MFTRENLRYFNRSLKHYGIPPFIRLVIYFNVIQYELETVRCGSAYSIVSHLDAASVDVNTRLVLLTSLQLLNCPETSTMAPYLVFMGI